MGLRVEDPRVQREDRVITEEEEEVLEGLGQEEALHNIIFGRGGAVDVSDARVASAGRETVAVQGLGREREKKGVSQVSIASRSMKLSLLQSHEY